MSWIKDFANPWMPVEWYSEEMVDSCAESVMVLVLKKLGRMIEKGRFLQVEEGIGRGM